MSLIGEGTYGKVYRPHKPCGTKMHKNAVGKVFRDFDDFSDELQIVKQVEQINSKHEFSIPFLEACPKNLQLIYADGGENLYDFSIDSNLSEFKRLLKLFSHICNGINVLCKNNLVHQDIKLENIVYNSKQNKLYLIDFGLMTHKSQIYIKENAGFLNYNYVAFPPEYKCYMYPDSFAIFYKMFAKNFSRSFFAFIKRIYKNYRADLKLLHSSKKYMPDKIDVYSLGMVLVYLYQKFEMKDKAVETAICNMICFDPVKRWSAAQAAEFFASL